MLAKVRPFNVWCVSITSSVLLSPRTLLGFWKSTKACPVVMFVCMRLYLAEQWWTMYGDGSDAPHRQSFTRHMTYPPWQKFGWEKHPFRQCHWYAINCRTMDSHIALFSCIKYYWWRVGRPSVSLLQNLMYKAPFCNVVQKIKIKNTFIVKYNIIRMYVLIFLW